MMTANAKVIYTQVAPSRFFLNHATQPTLYVGGAAITLRTSLLFLSLVSLYFSLGLVCDVML